MQDAVAALVCNYLGRIAPRPWGRGGEGEIRQQVSENVVKAR